MNNDDINEYIPSILNPRTLKKLNGDLTLSLTQNSVISRCSLSLKKKNVFSNANPHKIFPVYKGTTQNTNQKKNNNVSNKTLPTNAPKNKSIEERSTGLSIVEELNSDFSLDKENIQHSQNLPSTRHEPKAKTVIEASLGFSAIEDLNTTVANNVESSPFSLSTVVEYPKNDNSFSAVVEYPITDKIVEDDNICLISVSSATELVEQTVLDSSVPIAHEHYEYDLTKKPAVSVSFGVLNCDTVDVSTSNNIKRFKVSHKNNETNIECKIVESSQTSFDSKMDEEVLPNPPKKSAININLEIKRKRLSEENSKILILNTDAIEKLAHVIVQPPNYKLVKRNFFDTDKFTYSKSKTVRSRVRNGRTVRCDNLKQKQIDAYLLKKPVVKVLEKTFDLSDGVDNDDMSKKLGAADAVKCDHTGRVAHKVNRKDNEVSQKLKPLSKREPESPRPQNRKEPEFPKLQSRREMVSPKQQSRRDFESPRQQSIKVSSSDAQRVPSGRSRNDSASSHSPRKNVESIQFSLPGKSRSNRISLSPRRIPYFKIVAGTHFAVDAFSYGDIPNVKHYFLTHFHSDHYSGLKKSFNKILFCSKITADLCITRLGVNAKCIHIMNVDETISIDGVDVLACDANHCPGALMLVFTLPNGKTLLHTGDFRASPLMESYPIFWNKDIHTIYLDTTYCNPRYDFPTQDQSLEMALYLLRQKKLALEKLGRKFSSVLIVCGTYTIGKEKFFLGMARRVGCSVWACPEKDRVLQAVEGRSFTHAPPHSCQLHVVPMRDLTHEKLRSYLDSMHGAFTEVVAFKPSGWENGKNSTVVKDMITIHGIPYSEHSSFSELIRFVQYLKPKQVLPTVDISGGVKAVQKFFPCPLVFKEDVLNQTKVTDYYGLQNRQQVPAVT